MSTTLAAPAVRVVEITPCHIEDFRGSPLILLDNGHFVICHQEAVQVFADYFGYQEQRQQRGRANVCISDFEVASYVFADRVDNRVNLYDDTDVFIADGAVVIRFTPTHVEVIEDGQVLCALAYPTTDTGRRLWPRVSAIADVVDRVLKKAGLEMRGVSLEAQGTGTTQGDFGSLPFTYVRTTDGGWTVTVKGYPSLKARVTEDGGLHIATVFV